MSTKTTFKRIALVAVAALGLGVLSVAPSQATVSALTVSGANGTSTNSADKYVSDSTTAAVVTVAGLLDTRGDTVTVTFVQKSVPTGATANPYAYFLDTTTPIASSTQVDSFTGTTGWTDGKLAKVTGAGAETATAAVALGQAIRISHTSTGYVGAKLAVQLDSGTARIAGTYTYTAIVKSYNSGVLGTTTLTQDVSIVVPTAKADVTTVAPASSSAYLNEGTSYSTANDSAVAAVATASTTAVGVIYVTTKNANGSAAPESITASISGPGLICDSASSSAICGKSLTIAGAGTTTIGIRADGNAGVATISVKTTSVTFSSKTVTFYAKSPKTITATVNRPVIATGTTNNTNVIRATAKDADGNAWTGALYVVAVAAADALIAGSATTPVQCTYDGANSRYDCPVSGTLDGTANLKVVDQSLDVDGTYAAADSAASSDAVAIRVSTAAPASVKLAFDKATYGPGEQAIITATVLDAAGQTLPEKSIASLFTSSGIVSTIALGAVSTSTTLADTTWTIKGATSNSDPKNPTRPSAVTFVVTMPQASGTVTISATGSTGLALAGRVAVSASAEVVNASVDAATDAANEATDAANAATDAALAAADAADAATAAAQDASDAVAALSATVAKLVASLKAQITSLTNLVIKIQKKVKA